VSDIGLAAVIVAFFGLAIVAVQVLGRMIDRDPDADAFADEPPDTGAEISDSQPGRGGRTGRSL
jgi:hypothetical protein